MTTKEGGDILSVFKTDDLDDMALSISNMWDNWSRSKQTAMSLNDEVRNYLNAVDIDSTSASSLDHKNRTHIPKLSEIADGLKAQYWEAAFSSKEFFIYNTDITEEKANAENIQKWVQSKLEAKKFRRTVGRQLIDDYVDYGNCFISPSYVRETDELGKVTFKGVVFNRIHPNSIVFDPTAESFKQSPTVVRKRLHLSDLADLPKKYPSYGFDEALIGKILLGRGKKYIKDWTDILQSSNLRFDGYGCIEDYLKSGYVELLIYRGDIFNYNTGEVLKNRVIYVIDRCHIVLNIISPSPIGYNGIGHAGWRERSNNLWAMGPLDNLIGMQWRTDSLENKKADIMDLISNPVLKIKGSQVVEPENGYAPNSVYYLGDDGDVSFLVPDTTALAADTQIARYHAWMEEFAGMPNQAQGIRTPGEKTAFEVDTLESNASRKFKDKIKLFENMIEEALKEGYLLMLANFDGEDYIETFDSIEEATALQQLTEEDIKAIGNFTAVGSEHFEQRRKAVTEMQQFQQGPMQDPKVRAHVSGFNLANYYENKLGIQNENIIEQYAGIKEDIELEAFAQAERARVQEQLQGPSVSPQPTLRQTPGVAQGAQG